MKDRSGAGVRRVIRGMVSAGFCVGLLCASACASYDEVARVQSPNGGVDAVVVEINGGATTSFGYEIRVVQRGAAPSRGIEVAYLYGAIRNDRAYGVNVRWARFDQLSIEFQDGQGQELERSAVVVNGQQIFVVLRPGISDPTAPPGGMLYNLDRS